jgi:flagellar biosynthetic protein FlhB
MAEDRENRTEQATPRRREKYREQGKIAMSQEIVSVAVLCGCGLVLSVVLGRAGDELKLLYRAVLGNLDGARAAGATELAEPVLRSAAVTFLPVAVAGSLSALASGFGQTRGLFAWSTLGVDFSRLSPLSKLKRMFFSKDALFAIGRSAGKVAVIIGFTWQLFWQELQTIVALGGRPPSEILPHLWSSTLRLGARVLPLLAAFAVLDFYLNRRRLERDMRMAKHEIKEEHREHEGDPEVKGRQRKRAREILKRLTSAQVKTADVVLVNPTHYAVALRYDAARAPAPQVVAKGQDEVAERIREVARQHQVPIVHNPPLARALYAEVRVGRLVPGRLYGAVAEVLAYVYRLRSRRAS